MSKALEQYKQAIMGGYDPTQAISYDNFMDARLSGLLNSMQNTNNTIQQNNLMDIGVEERKREEEKLARMKALREFGERMEILAQKRSGNPQIAAALQQQMDARKLAEQQRIEAAQKQQRLNAIYETLPPEQQRMMDMINAGVPKDVVESYFKKPEIKNPRIIKGADGYNYYEDGSRVLGDVVKPENKTTKSDFVVGILTKIQKDPTYGTKENPLTVEDQNILDIISNTDPMEKLRRELAQRYNTGFPNNTNQPITITTQDEFDKLAKGTKYIYNGTEYIKGQ
jgi:hypothetical protein